MSAPKFYTAKTHHVTPPPRSGGDNSFLSEFTADPESDMETMYSYFTKASMRANYQPISGLNGPSSYIAMSNMRPCLMDGNTFYQSPKGAPPSVTPFSVIGGARNYLQLSENNLQGFIDALTNAIGDHIRRPDALSSIKESVYNMLKTAQTYSDGCNSMTTIAKHVGNYVNGKPEMINFFITLDMLELARERFLTTSILYDFEVYSFDSAMGVYHPIPGDSSMRPQTVWHQRHTTVNK